MVTVTQLAIANPLFRDYNRARTLLNTLNKKREFLKDEIKPIHTNRYTDVTIDLKIFLSRLDSKQFKCETPKWLRWPVKDVVNYVYTGINRDHSKQYTALERETVSLMHEIGRSALAHQHKFNLQCEIAHRASQGWFFVFDTLTVGDGALSTVFHPKSTAFRDYVRRINYDTRIAGGFHPGDDYHTYFAVTELGGKTGRLHIHCLHALRALPLGTRCPNTGEPRPIKRELPRFKRYWDHGFSVPIGVRYSASDAFGLVGFRWPMDPATGAGLKAKSPQAIAGYMAKYVLKAYQSDKRSDYKWRVKKNHNYGQPIQAELVSMLTTQTMTTMIHNDQITATINQQTVPKQQLRKHLLRRLQSIHGMTAQFEELGDTPSQAGLLQRLQDLTQRSPTSSPSSSIASNAPGTSNADISDAQAELNRAALVIDERYFPKTTYTPKANSTRAH